MREPSEEFILLLFLYFITIMPGRLNLEIPDE